jgi:hypothetical protein
MRLHSAHFHPQNPLALGRQTLDDVLLQATKHHMLELIMQILDLALVVRVRELKLVSGKWDYTEALVSSK